jgi:hypothetical protein
MKRWEWLSLLVSKTVFACACGCGVFEVTLPSMMPRNTENMVFFKYTFMDQNETWHGSSKSDSVLNPDHTIRTNFFTIGYQRMFNRSWGIHIEIPFWDRYFETDNNPNATAGTIDNSPEVVTTEHFTLSDIRIMGIYSGFSPDMSTGLLFGFILPTGPHNLTNLQIEDPDTQPGYGSLGSLLGFYHYGYLTKNIQWFSEGLWRHQFYGITESDGGTYKPGDSYNVSLGAYYLKFMQKYHVSPFLEAIYSVRNRDDGSDANPQNSGFQRLFVAPGIEYKFGNYDFSANVQIPIYTYVNGYQQVAPYMFSANVSYSF